MTTTAVTPSRRILSAAWRITLAVITFGVGLTVMAALTPDTRDASDPLTLSIRIASGVVISILTIAVIVLLARKADQRSIEYAGLTSPRSGWRLALWGALVWLVPATVTFGVLALLGTPLTVTVPTAELAQTLLLLVVAVLVTEALPEEVVFRGYATSVLGTVTRGWWTIVAQAVLFTLFAGLLRQNWNPTDVSLFFSMGIGLGYLRMITGSVWMPIGFHTAFQTGAQLVLAHDAVEFAGGQGAAMLALGVVPFTVGAIVVASTGVPRFARPVVSDPQ